MRDSERMTIPDMLKAGCFDGVAVVAELKQSPYYALLTEAYDKLESGRLYESGVHGPSHVERVMLLGAIIAMQQGFSERETELLLIACSYHDIGRENDRVDGEHGERSAKMIKEIPLPGVGREELRCIRAAVATHSTSDWRIDSFARQYRVAEEDMELCRLLCKGLKDADNLDRVRIRDLDVRYLRYPESKRMAAAAQAIYDIGEGRRRQR